MKSLKLKNIKLNLSKFDKIVVTGPLRSGTTISSMIIADELNYEFIDESFYEGGNQRKFMKLILSDQKKIVIHNTGFLRDLHLINWALIDSAVVLIKRDIKDILRSFENSKKFKSIPFKTGGFFTNMDELAQKKVLMHYGYIYSNKSLPEVTYEYFYKYAYKFVNLFELEYKKLKKHKLFIPKKERRINFQNIKQVKLNDPEYLLNLKKENAACQNI